jgi:hypothetical protein
MDHQRFTDGDDTFLCPGNGTLQHEIVVFDNTVMGEATHGCDGFFGNVGFGRRVSIVRTGTNTVDLLVKFRAMVITIYRQL